MADVETYAIAAGGPLWRAERRLRIVRDDRHDLWRCTALAIAIGYVPLLVTGIRWRIATGAWSLGMLELTSHLRPLVMLPLLLVAEWLLEERAGGVGRYLLRSGIVAEDCLGLHRSAIARTVRLRDSSLVEAALFAAALASAFTTPALTRAHEPAIAWILQPGAVLYRFLALRLLWRWLLWTFYLVQLSRLPLTLRATHPDRFAGLAPLSEPSTAFALVVMAGATAAAARWGDRMRFDGVSAALFAREAVAYAVTSLVIAAGPLAVFTRRLFRMRRLGMQSYGAFANRYTDAFERRWLDRPGEEALGSPDIQSLADLGGTFGRVEQIRPLLVPRITVAFVVAGAFLPMLPLAIAEVGAATLLMRLAKVLL